jgi:hypothetical protein
MHGAAPSAVVVLDFHDPGQVPRLEEAPREDLSAVACTGPCLWLASDETATVERLTTRDGRTFAGHHTFPLGDMFNLPAGADEEIDIEGMTVEDGYLWIAGSHSRVRKKPKDKHSDAKAFDRLTRVQFRPNRNFIARVPLVEDDDGLPALAARTPHGFAARLRMDEAGSSLSHALRDDEHIGRFLEIPAKENGFDIEGLAGAGDRLFLGLRGPVLRGWALILEITAVVAGDDGVLDLVPITPDGLAYRKHFLDLGGLGIRDLVRRGEDLVILAGPTMDLDGPVAVHLWPGGAVAVHEQIVRRDRLPRVLDLPYGAGTDHAEGLAFLGGGDEPERLLVVYDSPGPNRRLPDGNVLADLFAPDWGRV